MEESSTTTESSVRSNLANLSNERRHLPKIMEVLNKYIHKFKKSNDKLPINLAYEGDLGYQREKRKVDNIVRHLQSYFPQIPFDEVLIKDDVGREISKGIAFMLVDMGMIRPLSIMEAALEQKGNLCTFDAIRAVLQLRRGYDWPITHAFQSMHSIFKRLNGSMHGKVSGQAMYSIFGKATENFRKQLFLGYLEFHKTMDPILLGRHSEDLHMHDVPREKSERRLEWEEGKKTREEHLDHLLRESKELSRAINAKSRSMGQLGKLRHNLSTSLLRQDSKVKEENDAAYELPLLKELFKLNQEFHKLQRDVEIKRRELIDWGDYESDDEEEIYRPWVTKTQSEPSTGLRNGRDGLPVLAGLSGPSLRRLKRFGTRMPEVDAMALMEGKDAAALSSLLSNKDKARWKSDVHSWVIVNNALRVFDLSADHMVIDKDSPPPLTAEAERRLFLLLCPEEVRIRDLWLGADSAPSWSSGKEFVNMTLEHFLYISEHPDQDAVAEQETCKWLKSFTIEDLDQEESAKYNGRQESSTEKQKGKRKAANPSGQGKQNAQSYKDTSASMAIPSVGDAKYKFTEIAYEDANGNAQKIDFPFSVDTGFIPYGAYKKALDLNILAKVYAKRDDLRANKVIGEQPPDKVKKKGRPYVTPNPKVRPTTASTRGEGVKEANKDRAELQARVNALYQKLEDQERVFIMREAGSQADDDGGTKDERAGNVQVSQQDRGDDQYAERILNSFREGPMSRFIGGNSDFSEPGYAAQLLLLNMPTGKAKSVFVTHGADEVQWHRIHGEMSKKDWPNPLSNVKRLGLLKAKDVSQGFDYQGPLLPMLKDGSLQQAYERHINAPIGREKGFRSYALHCPMRVHLPSSYAITDTLLDGGSDYSLISSDCLKRLQVRPEDIFQVREGSVSGLVSSNLKIDRAVFMTFNLRPGKSIFRHCLLVTEEPTNVPVILGNDFLRKFRVLLNHVYLTATWPIVGDAREGIFCSLDRIALMCPQTKDVAVQLLKASATRSSAPSKPPNGKGHDDVPRRR